MKELTYKQNFESLFLRQVIRDAIDHDKLLVDLYLDYILLGTKQSEICSDYGYNKDWLCKQFKQIKDKIKQEFDATDF